VRELSVKGRNLSEGVPRSFTLNSNEILEPAGTAAGIVSAVKQALEQTHPSSARCGRARHCAHRGGALLRDIDKLLMEETGLPVVVAETRSPVWHGRGRILELMDQMDRATSDWSELRARTVATARPSRQV